MATPVRANSVKIDGVALHKPDLGETSGGRKRCVVLIQSDRRTRRGVKMMNTFRVVGFSPVCYDMFHQIEEGNLVRFYGALQSYKRDGVFVFQVAAQDFRVLEENGVI